MAALHVFNTEGELQDAILAEEDQHTIHYVKQRRQVYSSFDDMSSLTGKRIRFCDDGHPSSLLNVPYDGTAFVVLGNEVYECQQGPQHVQSNLTKKDQSRLCTRNTKKMNCPAQIRIHRILQFPDFKINGTPTTRAKRLMSASLKSEFGPTTERRLVIYALMAGKDDHQDHPIGEVAEYTQSLDRRVTSKIKELANNGHRNVGSVKVLLSEFAKELAPQASEGNRRYYPTNSDIRNHIYHAVVGTSLQSAHDDQLEMAKYLEAVKKSHPNDNYFFRPASCEGEAVSSLLLVMQTAFQRRLMNIYGQEIVLMDATYKTTKYELPLYNICINSNSGYHIVASFFISKDTLGCVSEALKVIQNWNPSWRPAHFMCDFDLREIGAVEAVFKGAHVFLCDFHRDQAWQRWMSANRVSDKVTVLKKLRAVAAATEEHQYQASLLAVQLTPQYIENECFRNWFEKKWVHNAKRWVFLYRKDLSAIISTTNGVENQHKEMKHRYIKEFGIGKSICNVAAILLEKFFPDAEIRYKRANCMGRDDIRTYAADVPPFLQNRPKLFVRHCMERIPPQIPELKDIVAQDNNRYEIPSVHCDTVHVVTIKNDMPQCTCKDFIQKKWPCKHILALRMQFNLELKEYFGNPLFVLDSELFSKDPVADVDKCSKTETNDGNNTEHPKVTEVTCRQSCLEFVRSIENSLYMSNEVVVLEGACDRLEDLARYMEENTASVSGLPTRKRRKWRRTSCRRVTMKRKPTPKISRSDSKKSTVSSTAPIVLTPNEQELMAIWSNPPNDETILQLGPFNITTRSLHFLKTTLSDEIMDGYLLLLTQGTNVLHISSVIATAIFQGHGNACNFLTQENFDQYDACIAAVNEGGHHWVLIIIQPQERNIIYINPMGENRTSCNLLHQFWCNFIAGRNPYSHQQEPLGWSIKTVDHSKQFDSVSCGVYVLKFAENFLGKSSLNLNWSKKEIVEERKRIALRLMNCGYEEHPILKKSGLPLTSQPPEEHEQASETIIEDHPIQEQSGLPLMSQPPEEDEQASETIPEPVTGDTEFKEPVMQRKRRKQCPKEKRSSFIYPKMKKNPHLFCVCQQRNDSRMYWQCEVCEEWYHPGCLGLDEENEPSQFICEDCKLSQKKEAKDTCMDVGTGQNTVTKKKKRTRHVTRISPTELSSLDIDMERTQMQEWLQNMRVPALALEATPPVVLEEDGDVYESSARSITKEVFSIDEIENALHKVYTAVSCIASGMVKSAFHDDFMEGNRRSTRGYGLLRFTSETYMALEVWVRKTFQKEITKDMFTKWGTVRGAGEQLLIILQESPGNADVYMHNVVFKEVITRTYVALNSMAWKDAVSMCKSTEAESWLKAMRLVIALQHKV